MLLTQLPVETIHQILSLVEPEDLGNVASTCRSLNNFIKGNNALCRDIYLRILVYNACHSPTTPVLWLKDMYPPG